MKNNDQSAKAREIFSLAQMTPGFLSYSSGSTVAILFLDLDLSQTVAECLIIWEPRGPVSSSISLHKKRSGLESYGAPFGSKWHKWPCKVLDGLSPIPNGMGDRDG